MDKFQKAIDEWINKGATVIARHQFERLGAMLVVTQEGDEFSVFRFFTIGDRVECSLDVNSGTAAQAFQRLMEVVSI